MSVLIRAQPLQYPRAMSAPSTFQALLEAIAQYTLYNFDPDYTLAVKGPNTPATQDNNKLWVQTDVAGRPTGLLTMYNGKWRQTATGNPFQIAMFAGDWYLYFDSTGMSTPGKPWDGWAIANGNNGTQNLTNKFIIPGYKYVSGAWVTNVSGADTSSGGANTFTVGLANLPPLSIDVSASGNFCSGGSWFSSTFPQTGSGQWQYKVAGTGQNLPISSLPPFIALGFVQYVGYIN